MSTTQMRAEIYAPQSLPRPFRRQFIIGPRPVPVYEDCRIAAVGDGASLSYCPELPVATAEDRSGERWYILGSPLQSDPARGTPIEEIGRATTEQVFERTDTWAGRWVLVGGGGIHMDASGLLGCYYTRISGNVWISSSVALLKETLDLEPFPNVRLRYGARIDWYPPPRTRHPQIRQLLVSQTLRLDGSVHPRPILAPVEPGLDAPEVIEAVRLHYETALRSAAALGKPLWLGLTGGLDSRLILALAHRTDTSLTTYSFLKPFPDMPRADRRFPPLLALAAGYDHRVIRGRGFSHSRLALFDRHTAMQCMGPDRTYFVKGYWEAIPGNVVVLPGGGFPVMQGYYNDLLPPNLPEDPGAAARVLETALRIRSTYANSSAHRDGVREWTEWILKYPTPGIDWRNRYYMEQRSGGWRAAIEQARDLTGHEGAFIANGRRIYSLLALLPPEMRRHKDFSVEMIRQAAPALLEYPINPRDPLVIKALRRAKREVVNRVGR